MRDLAASGVPTEVSLATLRLGRSAYYRWLAKPVTDSELAEAHLANAIFDAHRDDPEFGYRFLFDEVTDAGHTVSERTVWRICSANGWWSVFGKQKRGKRAKVGVPAHDDLVRRDFTAAGPNQLWLTDISEHRTDEGKLYICAIKDAWSNRIVGYSISDRMESKIAVDALNNAVIRRAVDGLTVAGCRLHSDRGSQFRSRKMQQALWRHHMVGSMGQVGSAGDNAAMESFFALLQKNVLNRRRWDTRDQLRIAIVAWIERTYHRRRRQHRLGRLTPIEFELIMSKAADQAA